MYDYEDDAIDVALMDCAKNFNDVQSESLHMLTNNASVVYSSADEIKKQILSEDVFSIEALVSDNSTTTSANAYYDFSKFSKYEITEWAYEIGALTEEEKIECFCDLIIDKNFDNIDCLNSIFSSISDFAENNILKERISKKIDIVLYSTSNKITCV